MTDHIADLLTRIRNSIAVSHYELSMPYSKMKKVILDILLREGYISDVSEFSKNEKKQLKIIISETKIPQHLRQISKSGQRIYVKGGEMPKPLRGLGLVIVSTSKGVVTGREASKMGIGGEVICEIW